MFGSGGAGGGTTAGGWISLAGGEVRRGFDFEPLLGAFEVAIGGHILK